MEYNKCNYEMERDEMMPENRERKKSKSERRGCALEGITRRKIEKEKRVKVRDEGVL